VPGIATHSGTRILERLVLQSPGGEADGASVLEESLAIGGDEMRHPLAAPDMPVQPEASIHRVNHPIPALLELEVGRGRRCEICVGIVT
jgi:hypothetical protein